MFKTEFVTFLEKLCYKNTRSGQEPMQQHQRSEKKTMSTIIKEARPIAEAAVISVAIVVAALAVPAAILFAAV